MKKIQITKNLYLHEYIPKELYVKYHKDKPHFLIGLIDKRIVTIDQFLRDRFGKITINNWFYGGDRNWSGIRIHTSPYYKQFSQHTYGRASDSLHDNISAEEIREDIKKNYVSLYKELGLTCIEKNVNWLHKDCRYHNFKGHEGTGLLIV